jgi:hypothetical protein
MAFSAENFSTSTQLQTGSSLDQGTRIK